NRHTAATSRITKNTKPRKCVAAKHEGTKKSAFDAAPRSGGARPHGTACVAGRPRRRRTSVISVSQFLSVKPLLRPSPFPSGVEQLRDRATGLCRLDRFLERRLVGVGDLHRGLEVRRGDGEATLDLIEADGGVRVDAL